MPTYSRPGVYFNESTLSTLTTSGVDLSAGTSAVFFGEAERGPTAATLITDWASYKDRYGDLDNAYDLGYSVYHYFANGGRSCFCSRGKDSMSYPIIIGNLRGRNGAFICAKGHYFITCRSTDIRLYKSRNVGCSGLIYSQFIM